MVRHKSLASAAVNRTMFYAMSARQQLAHLLRRPSAFNHAMLVTRRMFRALRARDRDAVWRVVATKIGERERENCSERERENCSMRFAVGSGAPVRVRISERDRLVRVREGSILSEQFRGEEMSMDMVCLMNVLLISNSGTDDAVRGMPRRSLVRRMRILFCANPRCVLVEEVPVVPSPVARSAVRE